MASTHAVAFGSFSASRQLLGWTGKMKKSTSWTQRADPKSGLSGGPTNVSGLLFLNSSGEQFAGPKTGPLGRAEKSLAAPLSFGVLRPDLWL